MSDNGGRGAVSAQLQIRRIIFEKFNDTDLRFTNDEIFGIMRGEKGHTDDPCDVCDVESEFDSMCKSGLVRNIAQNFNTMWFMLFDLVDEIRCNSCSSIIHLGRAEERRCPNPACGASLK